jgi:hypothetical protein
VTAESKEGPMFAVVFALTPSPSPSCSFGWASVVSPGLSNPMWSVASHLPPRPSRSSKYRIPISRLQ